MALPPPRGRLARLWLLLSDPARWSAERYASSSAMHLSALHPETWRQDLGPQAPAPAAAPSAATTPDRAGRAD